jgi:PAS domain S-box-containing protein
MNETDPDTMSREALVEELKRLRAEDKSLSGPADKRYRALVEGSSDFIYVLDREGRFTFANNRAQEVLGLAAEELIGRHFSTILHTQDAEEMGRAFHERRTGERALRRFEVRLQGASGETRQVEMDIRHVAVRATGIYEEEDFVGTHGVARDITERKVQEEEQQALQQVRDEVWNMANPADIEKVLAVARKTIAVLGIAGVDCIVYIVDVLSDFPTVRFHKMDPGGEWWDLSGKGEDKVAQVWLDQAPVYRRDLGEASAAEERQNLERVFGHPVSAVLDLPFSHGTLSVTCNEADIFTQRHIDFLQQLAETLSGGFRRQKDLQQLDRSETRYRKLVETPHFVLMLLETDGRYIYVSPQIQSFTHYLPEEFNADLDGEPSIILEEDRKQVREAFGRAVEGQSVQNLEFRWKRKDEEQPLWVSGSMFPLYESTEYEAVNRVSMIQMVVQDISERRRMEQDLVRIARLRALWEVSAGIGHNLNNILVGVLGPAQLLRRRSDDERTCDQLDGIITSARRARELVQRLYQAVRGEEEEPLTPISVNDVIQEAMRTAQPRWKDEAEARGIPIEVTTDLDKNAFPVQGTQAGFNDIIVNLLFNAVDAMPDGGTIRIVSRFADGKGVVTVSDTGMGMDEETRQRVFEPFFTTKAEVGTGLGLSTVYGSVSRWGGTVEVDSSLERGTSFHISLLMWGTAGVDPQEDVPMRQGRRGRIIVVEDDEVVRQVVSSLVGERHEVDTFADGPAALEQVKPGLYDVALLDLGMPVMPGDQVSREIRSIDPTIATVLITGWELADTDPKLSLFDFQLQKPLDDIDLVQDVLARAIELHDERVKRNR